MKIPRPLVLFFVLMSATACKKASDTAQPVPAKQPATPTIVILGSSTAEGVGANPIDSCWADRLQAALLKVNPRTRFFNLALGAYTTYQAMPTGFSAPNRPAPDTARNITKALSYKPTLVLINFPSNDVSDGFSNSEIVNNYKVIARQLDSAKTPYIIFSTQPRDFSDPGQRMRLKTLNDTVTSVFTYRVNNFLDTLSTPDYSIRPRYDSGDGIHLNDAGHTVIFGFTCQHPVFQSFLKSCQ